MKIPKFECDRCKNVVGKDGHPNYSIHIFKYLGKRDGCNHVKDDKRDLDLCQGCFDAWLSEMVLGKAKAKR